MRRSLFILIAGMLAASPLAAQHAWQDARVLPPGVLSLRAGAAQLFATERFTPGGREPLPSPALPTAADAVVGGPALRSGVTALFAELEASHQQPPPSAAADPALLTAGDFAARVSYDRRTVPLELSAGVLPRVQISARVPLVREMQHRHAPRFEGANLGANPDPAHNRQVLEALGFGDLGGSAVLPLAGSPVGDALATRVTAATGAELILPEQPLAFATYRSLLAQGGQGFALEHLDSEWRGAAFEGSARVLLLSREAARPDGTHRFGYRLALEATALRMLITAPEPYAEGALGEEMTEATGTAGALLVDLLLADRGEVHARLSSATRDGRSWTEATLAPRVRFAGALALGGIYSFVRAGGSDESEARPAGAIHLVGAGLAYSTLPAARADRRVIPVEAALVYRAAVAGDAGFPAVRSLAMEGRIFYDLLRRRR
jgi:hypothetical protein